MQTMNPESIFLKKVGARFNYYASITKSVVDWSIFLYVVIPSIVFFAGFYYYYVTDIPSGLIEFLNSYFIYFLAVYSLTGKIHTYLETPDRIFLITNKKFVKRIILNGFALSFLKIAAVNALVFLLAIPFISESKFTVTYAELTIITTICQFAVSLSIYMLSVSRLKKATSQAAKIIMWLWGIVHALSLLHFNQYIIFIVIIDIILSISLIAIKYFSSNIIIEKEIEIAGSNQNILLKAVLQQSGALENIRIKPNNFYKNNQTLLSGNTPEDIFIDSFLKTIVRNRKKLTLFLEIIVFLVAAIILIENTWMKEIVLIFGIILFRGAANNEWGIFLLNFKGTNFRQVEKLTEKTYGKLQRIVSWPLAILLLLVAGTSILFYSIKEAAIFFLLNSLCLFVIKKTQTKTEFPPEKSPVRELS